MAFFVAGRDDRFRQFAGALTAFEPMTGMRRQGAVLFGDKIADKLLQTEEMYLHGITFGGHPIVAAAALKNLEIMEREGVIENVRNNQDYLRDQLLGLMERYEIVGDVRGAGYHQGDVQRRGVQRAAARLPLADAPSGGPAVPR